MISGYNVALSPAEIKALRWENVNCTTQISQEPKDTSTTFGLPAAFEVGAIGNPSFLWEVNDGSGFKALNSCWYSGTTASKLNILACLPGMDGLAYRCILDNDTCLDTTKTVYLSVDTAIYHTYIDSIHILDTITYYDSVTVVHYDTLTYYDTITVFHYDTLTYYDTSYITISTYDSVSVTDTLIISVVLGGSTPSGNKFLVYPNPARDYIYIDNGNYSVMSGYRIEISNALGQTVFNSQINQAQFYINLSSWSGKGIYFLYLKDAQGNTIESRKIILQ